jgi:hypothetical protein
MHAVRKHGLFSDVCQMEFGRACVHSNERTDIRTSSRVLAHSRCCIRFVLAQLPSSTAATPCKQ